MPIKKIESRNTDGCFQRYHFLTQLFRLSKMRKGKGPVFLLVSIRYDILPFLLLYFRALFFFKFR